MVMEREVLIDGSWVPSPCLFPSSGQLLSVPAAADQQHQLPVFPVPQSKDAAYGDIK